MGTGAPGKGGGGWLSRVAHVTIAGSPDWEQLKIYVHAYTVCTRKQLHTMHKYQTTSSY